MGTSWCANGMLYNEVMSSVVLHRYSSTFWNRQKQPVQDVVAQYNSYIGDGYNNVYWRYQTRYSNNYGVGITCFVAFDNKNFEITRFLDLWYQQTLQYTTQDQVSFPYVCWKLKAHPYTLPNDDIQAVDTNKQTSIYIKHDHGK